MQVYSNQKHIICHCIIKIRKLEAFVVMKQRSFLEYAQVQQLLLPIQQLTKQ